MHFDKLKAFILTCAVVLSNLVSFSAFGVQAPAAPAALRLKSYLKISDGDRVTLGQLVDATGLSPVVLKRLATISLGSAPGLGEQRIYSSSVIAEAIRSDAVISKMKTVIPNKVTVENRGFELNQEAITTELFEKWQAACDDCTLKMRRLSLPVLPIELQNRPWTVDADAQIPKGTFNVKLFVKRANGTDALYWLNGQVEVQKLVPVLSRSVQMGQRLTAEDFKWEWRDVTLAQDGFPNENGIVGQKLRMSTSAGQILFFQNLAREKAIQRGEVVQAQVGDGAWQVSLEAVTEQDGYVGDIVNIRNRQSNKILSGEVVGRGEVRIR